MNAPDLGFLGPARQARTGAARETRLSGEGTAPSETSDFAVAMGNPGAPARAAEKPRAAREAAGAPREGTATAADTVGEAMTGPGDPPLTAEAPADATLTEQGLADGALADAAPTEAMPTAGFPTGLAPRPDTSERARASDAAGLAAPEEMSTAGMGAVEASPPKAGTHEVGRVGNGPGQAQPEGAPGATPGAVAARSGAGAVTEAVIEGVPANAASAPEALGATAAIQRSAVPAPGTGTGKSAVGSDTPASPLRAGDPSTEDKAPTLAGPASRDTDPAILDAAADAAGFATRTDPAAVADAASSGQPSITQLTISPLSMGNPDAAPRLMQAAPAEAPPGQTRAVVEQIAVAVAESDESRVEIRLDPAELGRVHISLTRTEHGLHAMVTAERPETLELLRRNAETLTRELGAAGYDSVSLDMSQGSRNFGGDGPPERPAEIYAVARGAQGAAGPGAAPISDTTRAGGRAAADGPLDIRL